MKRGTSLAMIVVLTSYLDYCMQNTKCIGGPLLVCNRCSLGLAHPER
jgi:hypothetical protein